MCTWISTIKFTGTLLNQISFSCPWGFPQSMTSYRGYATTRRYSYLSQLELYELFVEIAQTITKNTEKHQHQRHLRGTWVHMHNRKPTLSNPDSDLVLIPDICFAHRDPIPANPRKWGELQRNNVSAICVFIWSPESTQLNMMLEGARSLPLAPGIYCGRDQDNRRHRTGSIVNLHQPDLHGMHSSVVCDSVYA